VKTEEAKGGGLRLREQNGEGCSEEAKTVP
jgi:hypothetical protein